MPCFQVQSVKSKIIFSRKIFPSSASWPSLSTQNGADSQHRSGEEVIGQHGDRLGWHMDWRFSPIHHAAGPMPVSFTPGFQFQVGDIWATWTSAVEGSVSCQMEIYHKGPFSGFLATGGRPGDFFCSRNELTEATRFTLLVCFKLQNHDVCYPRTCPPFDPDLYSMGCPVLAALCSPFCTLTVRRSGLELKPSLPGNSRRSVQSPSTARAFGRTWRESWLTQRSIHPCTWSLHSSYPQCGVWRWNFVSCKWSVFTKSNNR